MVLIDRRLPTSFPY